VHVEACTHLHRTIQHIKSLGKRAAVAVNPHSPLDGLRYVLGELDMVLLMTVNPGFGGQSFISAVLPKIRELRAEIERQKLMVDIEVDGGIKADNVAIAAEAGANVFVSGSGVFGHKDYAKVIAAIRANAEAAARAGLKAM
jgi:ribulose-phosphate 3-epimerase